MILIRQSSSVLWTVPFILLHKDSAGESDLEAIATTSWSHRKATTPPQGEDKPSMDGPGKPLRRHSRGAPLWSPSSLDESSSVNVHNATEI
jgi:hypothetical protein